ncbi:MAG TPA: SulP family inorganic anion transporter [Rhabdochlamydiaceae bacterium]|nr:SulP family inorganic anion transporter [Rhabdochlamydiaceae bacterium]
MFKRFKPELFSVLQEGYGKSHLFKDLIAGLVVGILALPMAIAFAIASGVRPEQGLYTAIIAGFFISLLGGSRYQVSGPTGAFVVLIYTIVQKYGYDGLAAASILAGCMLVMMAFFGLGRVLKFVPYPVTIGFTAGLAVVLFVGQLRDFFGLQISVLPAEFIPRIAAYSQYFHTINPYACSVGLLGMLLAIFWPRLVTPKIPGAIVAIVATTALVYFLKLPVETIADRFQSVPDTFPALRFPSMNWNLVIEMFFPAISIALLAGIESLLSAVVADGMTGKKHKSDKELFAQGVGNILSILFNGIPATGAFARTATNIKTGAVSPLAGMFHAVFLLVVVLFLGRWVALIPMPTLAGILIVVCYNMSEWRYFAKLCLSPKYDIAVLLVTFFLTVFVGLVPGIQAGVVLAAFLFMQTMANRSEARYIQKSLKETEKQDPSMPVENIPEGVEVFEIYGPFFFAAVEKFKTALSRIHLVPKVLILRMRHVLTIDATGIRALEDILAKAKREGTVLILSGVKPHVHEILTNYGFIKHVGSQYIFSDFEAALKYATEIVQPAVPVRATEIA